MSKQSHQNRVKRFRAESAELLAMIAAKYPDVTQAIVADKGESWAAKQLWGNRTTVEQGLSDLIYYHFLESPRGKSVWGQGEQSDEKVDRIMDAITSTYVEVAGPISLTTDQWEDIVDDLYSMVYEGVF